MNLKVVIRDLERQGRRRRFSAFAALVLATATIASPVLAEEEGDESSPIGEEQSPAWTKDYPSRAAAEAAARQMRQAGRQVEVRSLLLPVSAQRLQVGYFPTEEQAEAAEKTLRSKSFPPTTILRTHRGFAVSLGIYTDAATISHYHNRLSALGMRAQLAPTTMEQERHQIVEYGRPPPAQRPLAARRTEPAPESPATTPPQPSPPPEDISPSIASTLKLDQPWAVYLGPYQSEGDAAKAAAAAESQGIAVELVTDPSGNFSIKAGEFFDTTNLNERYQQLHELGFPSVKVSRADKLQSAQWSSARLETQPSAPPESSASKKPMDDPEVLVFGEAGSAAPLAIAGAAPAGTTGADARRISLDAAVLKTEAGGLVAANAPAEGSHFLFGELAARASIGARWEFRLAGRGYGRFQTGDVATDESELEYGDSFVRLRGERYRLTLGPQTVIWGRLDEIVPSDRLSRFDLTRHVLDDMTDRRRPVPAIRLENYIGDYKADLLWVPWFQAAALPAIDSVWSPVDKRNGRLAGIPDSPALQALVANGTFDENEDGSGGYGVRVSRTGDGIDYAFTVQRARYSPPYFQLDPAARATLLATGNPAAALAAATGATFVAEHPLTWVGGGDLSFVLRGTTWRIEAAYLSDAPATTTDLRLITVPSVDWGTSLEFYPGDSNLRINLQVNGQTLLTDEPVLDRKNPTTLLGMLENTFAHDRWRFKLRAALGLDQYDTYINPRLAYTGWEPHEIYLAAHYFSGTEGTLGGFHADHDIVTLGWQTRY